MRAEILLLGEADRAQVAREHRGIEVGEPGLAHRRHMLGHGAGRAGQSALRGSGEA